MRLVARFPCNLAGFSACSTPSLTDPEHPRKAPNLSPEPSPNAAALVVGGGNRRASPGRPVARLSSVLVGGASGETRLALRADGVDEARHAGSGECAQELVEWPGWVEVGG